MVLHGVTIENVVVMTAKMRGQTINVLSGVNSTLKLLNMVHEAAIPY